MPNYSNPYPGLRAFTQQEDFLFFGRDKEISNMLLKIKENRFSVMAGPSGSGKTSLLQAGILPAIARGALAAVGEEWSVLKVTAGTDTMKNMAHSLAEFFREPDRNKAVLLEAGLRAGPEGLIDWFNKYKVDREKPVLLVIDQLEEVVIQYHKELQNNVRQSVARQVLSLLLYTAQDNTYQVFVTGIIRSSYLNQFTSIPGMAKILNKAGYVLQQPAREDCYEIIHRPAAMQQIEVSDPLIKQLAATFDVAEHPLPKLQFLLYAMTEQAKSQEHKNRPLDLELLGEAGGFNEAFNQFAEGVYSELDAENQMISEKVFKALISHDILGNLRFQSLSLQNLAEITQMDEARIAEAIEHFRQQKHGILFPGPDVPLRSGTMIYPGHESMIDLWKRLNSWALEEKNAAEIYRKLHESAMRYQNQQEGLWEAPELLFAQKQIDFRELNENWAEQYGGNFSETMAFFNESLRNYESREQEKIREQEDKLARQRKIASVERGIAARNRWLAIGAVAFGVFALILAYIFHVRKVEVKREMVRSQSDMFLAYSDIYEERDPTKALNYAYRAMQSDKENPAAYGAMVRIFYTGGPLYKELFTAQNPVNTLAISQNKNTMATGEGNQVSMRNLAGKLLYKLPHLPGQIRKVRFSAQGDFLVILHENSGITVWDVKRKRLIKTRTFPYALVDFSHTQDGNSIFVAASEGRIFRYNFIDDKQNIIFRATGQISSMDMGADKQILALGFMSGKVKLYRRAGKTLYAFQAYDNPVKGVTFSPRGNTVLTTPANETKFSDAPKLWNFNGELRTTFRKKSRLLTNAIFSRDGRYVFTASMEGIITQWDMEGNALKKLIGHETSVNDMVTDASNSNRLYSASGDLTGRDNSVKYWHTRERSRVLKDTSGMDMYKIDVNPRGNRLLTGGGSANTYVLDDTLALKYKVAAGGRNIVDAIWMDGEEKFAMALENGDVQIYSDKGRRLDDFTGQDTALSAIAWSETGRHFVIGYSNGTIRAYTKDGRKMSKNFGHRNRVNSLDVSRDGQLILSASDDSTAALWSLDGEKLIVFSPNFGKTTDAVFSPYSETIATTSTDSIVRLWTYQGKLKNRLKGHSAQVNAVEFAPSGNFIVTASDDYTLKLWKPSGKLVVSFKHGLYNAVTDAAFGPKGNSIYTSVKHYLQKDYSSLRSWNIKPDYLKKQVKTKFLPEETLQN